MIAKLPEADPALWETWVQSSRQAEGESHWLRQSGRFPLCGRGDVNTYSLFAELNRSLMGTTGRVGCITPPGIATDDTTKLFFSSLVDTGELSAFYEFENEDRLFTAVDHRVHFSLIGMARGRATPTADIVFNIRQVSQLADPTRHIELCPADFLALNPNTRTCPTFRWRRDAEINKKIYRRVPVLWQEADEESGNPWGIAFLRMFDMAGDSGTFKDREQCESEGYRLAGNIFEYKHLYRLPLYEAKMIHHFDHRFGTYEGQTESQSKQGKCPEFTDVDHADPTRQPLPYYWVDESAVSERLEGRWVRSWLLGWRDICRSGDMRTVIAAAIPRVAVGDKFLLMLPAAQHVALSACLLANLASLVLDFCARQKVGGTNLKYFVMKQLPVLPPGAYGGRAPWSDVTLSEWLSSRAIELSYTAHDMAGFASDCGYDGPPFRWDPERRAILRAELDAAFFHLYGIDQADTEYVLGMFPVLRDKEIREYRTYRTKDLVLERYEALATATSTGRPYVSPLASTNQITATYQRPARALKDGDWATPAGVAERDLTLFALLEVLRQAGGAIDAERVRLASIFVRKPAMALPFMDETTQREWSRLIGQDALPLPANVLDLAQFKKNAVDHLWRDAVSQLIGSNILLRDSETNHWSVGPGLPTSKQAWIEGRAEMAMRLARELELPKVERKIASFLKDLQHGATARTIS